VDLGHMEEVPPEEINKTPAYYIPHHAVIKPSSTTTKTRIVFDASAKTTKGDSLNSNLSPGPVNQPDLVRQVLHFREGPIGLKGDITKVYLQIEIHPDHRDLIRVVWRPSPDQPLKHFRLTVVPFGVTTAPYLATRTLLQLAMDMKLTYPEAAEILMKRFYVDDWSTSFLDEETARRMYEDIIKLLRSAGFEMRKFATNSTELLSIIPEAHRETSTDISLDDTTTVKTLGISWNPTSDSFSFTCNPDMQRTHSKRNILSETSKVFDPLGLISPVIINCKILMQQIWKCQVDWDQPLLLN